MVVATCQFEDNVLECFDEGFRLGCGITREELNFVEVSFGVWSSVFVDIAGVELGFIWVSLVEDLDACVFCTFREVGRVQLQPWLQHRAAKGGLLKCACL